MTPIEQTHIGVIQSLFERVLNRGEVDLLPTLIAPDIAIHPGEERGFSAYQSVIARVRSSFSGCHFSLEDIIASGDRVAARWTMQAIHSGPLAGVAATGKHVVQHANVIFRFEDDKIAEVWTQMDQMGMLRQLGIDPIPGRARAQVETGSAQ